MDQKPQMVLIFLPMHNAPRAMVFILPFDSHTVSYTTHTMSKILIEKARVRVDNAHLSISRSAFIT